MDASTSRTLSEIDKLLENDLLAFNVSESDEEQDRSTAKTRRKQQERFIKYLISVATHPIGLLPSVSPFNCDHDLMLAYIMDMFSLDENKMKAMIEDRKKGDRVKAEGEPVAAKKRHSWRSELRVRLNAPPFFFNKSLKLRNLFVRVYLFKHQPKTDAQERFISERTDDETIRSRGILNRIFKRFQVDPDVLIRPVREMRYLLGFEPHVDSDRTASHRMVILDGDTFEIEDLHMKIRRYYCDPESRYILRFEFWSKMTKIHRNLFDYYRSFIKRLVYDGCNCRRQSTYMNEDYNFYGYLNIKLSQIPSYAIKQNQSILSLGNRIVNNCEVLLELRNRRISDGGTVIGVETASKNIVTTKPKQEYIVNHIRLYANCLMYQCNSLDASSWAKLIHDETSSNMSLYNLLYLPAYTLINQHRLQSNLSQLEDQGLERVSILLLLLKLEQKSTGKAVSTRLIAIRLVLIYILQNEYITAHRRFNDRTMQEVDPFQDDISEVRPHSLTSAIELSVLEQFVHRFLNFRLRKWPVRESDEKSRFDSERLITLQGLKLIRSALHHFKKSALQIPNDTKSSHDIATLKSLVDQVLCKVVFEYLVSQIINLSVPADERQVLTGSSISTSGLDDESLWLRILQDIKYINHDICLYWSKSGLDGIIKNEQEYIENSDIIRRLTRENIKDFVKGKIDNYLR